MSTAPDQVTSLTRRLAEFICRLTYERLPDEVRLKARAVIADALCVSLAGTVETPEVARPIRDVAATMRLEPEATVWVTGETAPAALAALVNATSGHTIDLDDTHMASIAHLGVPVTAAAMALAERQDAPAAELLTAVVAGFEVGGLVGRSANPGHYRRWHSTATIGGIAAAAAAARLLRLDPPDTDRAIGFAADDSGGTHIGVKRGDYTKSLHAGTAAWKGTFAALLVRAGANGPEGVFEHEVGWYFVYTEERTPERLLPLLDHLGALFQILEVDFKAYPCVHSSHTAIEATIELVRTHDLAPEEIREIRVRQPVYTNPGLIYDPQTRMAARMSTPYGIAWAAIDRELNLNQYAPTRLRDPRLREMIQKVKIISDPDLNRFYPPAPVAHVEIETRDGRTFTGHQLYPQGSHRRPFAPVEHRVRLIGLASRALGTARAERLVDFLMNLRGDEPVRELARLLVASGGGS